MNVFIIYMYKNGALAVKILKIVVKFYSLKIKTFCIATLSK